MPLPCQHQLGQNYNKCPLKLRPALVFSLHLSRLSYIRKTFYPPFLPNPYYQSRKSFYYNPLDLALFIEYLYIHRYS
jgi:hypothetical protein